MTSDTSFLGSIVRTGISSHIWIFCFEGVEKTYAIQAGREIRVFIKPEMIDDLGAVKLARSIADKIEKELKYPGEIKVNVIRETRAQEVAR